MKFNITPFENASGSKSFRVSGTKKTGERIRENYADEREAKLRQVELETEFLAGRTEASLRTTKLTDTQLALCETALARIANETELLPAIEYWLKHGRHQAVENSPLLSEAASQFQAWLASTACTLREKSKEGYAHAIKNFVFGSADIRLCDVTTESIEAYLSKMNVSALTKKTYCKKISGFFSWAIERPRRWLKVNPCAVIKIELAETKAPEVLSLAQCETLLRNAEQAGLAPYIALCLFGGLRPTEATRVSWQDINLTDREIRLDGTKTKTGRGRVIAICDTLVSWLSAYQNQTIVIPDMRGQLRKLFKSVASVWIPDVMRHTAVSHYFRKTGSYGQTAEQMGNSEAIIKQHYQGRVTSEDTKNFYAIMPTGQHNVVRLVA